MKRILLSLLLLVTSSVIFSPKVIAVENCREFNFKETFNFGYNAEFPTWNAPGTNRVITWATMDSGEINGKKIQRSFGSPSQEWLREAFQSWDDALDSVSFKEVSLSENIDIKIGWTQVLQLDYESLFNVKAPKGLRSNATLEFKHQSTFLIFKENFIQAAQSDIGHILGMGYITPSSEVISVMEWPFQAPYGQVPLGEFDVALIRAIYSESTCPSTFNQVIQAGIKDKQEIELKAKQEAEAEKIKEEAESKARAELIATTLRGNKDVCSSLNGELIEVRESTRKAALLYPTYSKVFEDLFTKLPKLLDCENLDVISFASNLSTQRDILSVVKSALVNGISFAELAAKQEKAAADAAAKKSITITCVKGKLTKKVTAVKPKCPSGYKLNK